MATPPRNGQLLYHFTDISNFESILQHGLLPREKVNDFSDIADGEIINYRKAMGLLRFVPFHFFAPSPFVGAVQTGSPDKVFIHICLKRDYARENDFKIILKHPLTHPSEFDSTTELEIYSYEEGINKINWDLMAKRDYFDEECKCVCMAECLSDKTINYEHFHCIYVQNKKAMKFILRTFENIVKRAYIQGEDFFINIADWCFKRNV